MGELRKPCLGIVQRAPSQIPVYLVYQEQHLLLPRRRYTKIDLVLGALRHQYVDVSGPESRCAALPLYVPYLVGYRLVEDDEVDAWYVEPPRL